MHITLEDAQEFLFCATVCEDEGQGGLSDDLIERMLTAFPELKELWWYETPEDRKRSEAMFAAAKAEREKYAGAPQTPSDVGIGTPDQKALDDEYKRLIVALRRGAEVYVREESWKMKLLDVKWPEWTYHFAHDNVRPGCNDDTWANILEQAGVDRHPRFA